MVVTIVARTDSRKTGLSKYAHNLYDTLRAEGHTVHLQPPQPPALPPQVFELLKQRGIDARTFFTNYPVRVDLQGADICHLTSQNLASLLTLRRMPPTVLTVHDLYLIVERMSKNTSRGIEQWIDRVAVAGIKKARAIMASSTFTRQTIIDWLRIPEDRISVVHQAVDTSVFRPLDVTPDFRGRLGLPPDAPLILYMGSEDPRKNLDVLIDAFHLIHDRVPETVLVKAGAVHFRHESERMKQKVERFGLSSHVFFVEQISEDDLALLYNTATIVVQPSLWEGFGLPALEGLSCGRPVIVANATSLPEVVGDAGVLFDPRRPDELAVALVRLLENPDQRQNLAMAGLAQSKKFSLQRQAAQVWDVYQSVYEQARRT